MIITSVPAPPAGSERAARGTPGNVPTGPNTPPRGGMCLPRGRSCASHCARPVGYKRCWDGFGVTFGVVGLAGAGVSTALIRLAWPGQQPRPAWRATFGRCIVFTVTASVLLSPVVTLLFGVALLPFSWPYLAALPAMLLILIPLAHGGLLGSWWRTLPPARAVGWLLASFIVLSLAAALIARLPTAAAVAVAGLVGVLNARAWYGVAAAVTRQEAPRPAPAAHPWAGVLGRPWTRGWPAPVSPFTATHALAPHHRQARLVLCLDRL